LKLPQIVFETFLEDVNNILTSGEVPNLFPKDELATVLDDVRGAAKAAGAGETAEALYAFWLERVRAPFFRGLRLAWAAGISSSRAAGQLGSAAAAQAGRSCGRVRRLLAGASACAWGHGMPSKMRQPAGQALQAAPWDRQAGR
jgi:hypothetical protein